MVDWIYQRRKLVALGDVWSLIEVSFKGQEQVFIFGHNPLG